MTEQENRQYLLPGFNAVLGLPLTQESVPPTSLVELENTTKYQISVNWSLLRTTLEELELENIFIRIIVDPILRFDGIIDAIEVNGETIGYEISLGLILLDDDPTESLNRTCYHELYHIKDFALSSFPRWPNRDEVAEERAEMYAQNKVADGGIIFNIR